MTIQEQIQQQIDDTFIKNLTIIFTKYKNAQYNIGVDLANDQHIYNFNKKFLWLPKRLANGKIKWLTTVMKKQSIRYDDNTGELWSRQIIRDCGYYTEEEAFLECV